MCTSKGAPPHPQGKKANDDVRSGANALWELLQSHNAVFLGDSDLTKDLEEFLRKHRIKRTGSQTSKQKEYVGVIEKGMKTNPTIVSA